MVNDKYKMILKIRTFEELILDLFGQNKLSGTTHTYIGEEATAVAIMAHVGDSDKIFSNHRCHGHYLAYGGPEELLLAEIMSKKSGLCQGRGGSQHIHYKNFYTNGIQGGIVPNALGVAFADKYRGKDDNTIVFIGDGTLGQGVVYESLNIAAIYEIPVMFVIEDNGYAMSTKRESAIAGDIKSRIEGFSVKTFEITSTDVDELDGFFDDAFSYIQTERKPVCAIVHNYRLAAHSKGDDSRDPKEVEKYRANDPVRIVAGKIGEEECDRIRSGYRQAFEELVTSLEKEDSIVIEPTCEQFADNKESFLSSDSRRYVECIREALHDQLAATDNLVIFGEDVCDPYGGAFKVTKGLSTEYKNQVLNMPISEACMTGMAVGMAMNGLLPVVEMMFGDFVTLGFDQLLNHASKYGWVYGDDVRVPMIVRTPMGAKRGYGPTHSQSLEKFLIGIPGVRILTLTLAVDPAAIYRRLFNNIQEPTVIVENKKMYGLKSWCIIDGCYKDFKVREINNYGYPSILLSLDPDSEPDCLAITYGGMDEETIEAAYDLMMEDEIQTDVLILTQLSPIPIADIEEAAPKATMIVTIEEGTKTSGVGAEIISQCVEKGISQRYERIATPDMPIPNGIVLEEQLVPGKMTIIDRIKEVVG